MVTRYDVISSRWSSHFWVKMHVFTTSFRNKSKGLWIKWCKVIIYVILHVKRKKLFILIVSTWFLILDKIQDSDHVWWRHRPPAAPPLIKYTSSWREDRRLSTEGKTVPKHPNISKPQGGGVHHPPLIPRWGYDFACTSEGWVTFS